VLKKNPKYAGHRPRHVGTIRVEENVGSLEDVLDHIESGQADWGQVPTAIALQQKLATKYGVNRSRFWLEPGLVLRHWPLNTSRALFRDVRLRRAVNYAINRAAVRLQFGGPRESSLTDQYLAPGLPGVRRRQLYPLNLRLAKRLARGHTRSGRAVVYVPDFHDFIAAAQVIQQNLERIGLHVSITRIPATSYFDRLLDPAEPWDMAFALWQPDYPDPHAYLNPLFSSHGDANLARFASKKYDRKLQRAAKRQGSARYRDYAKLDVELARDAAPSVATDFLNESTFVSKHVDRRCIVLRPSLDLTAVCLK
jgi:peptide/nickel transport system substrate-binding protein